MEKHGTEKTHSIKRKCKFSDRMKMKYPFFAEGRHLNEAKCLICDSYVSVGNKGIIELERHANTEKHRKWSLCIEQPVESSTMNITEDQKTSHSDESSAHEIHSSEPKMRYLLSCSQGKMQMKDSSMDSGLMSFSTSVREEDEFDLFGKNIAAQLKQLPIEDALELQLEIHRMVGERRLRLLYQRNMETALGS